MTTIRTIVVLLWAVLAAAGARPALAAPHDSLDAAASKFLAVESDFYREIERLPEPEYREFAPLADAIHNGARDVQEMARRGDDPGEIAARIDLLRQDVAQVDWLFVDIRDAFFGGYGALWRLDRLIGELKRSSTFLAAETDALQGYGPPPVRRDRYRSGREYRSYDGFDRPGPEYRSFDGFRRSGRGYRSFDYSGGPRLEFRSFDYFGGSRGRHRHFDHDDHDDDDDDDDDD